MDKFTEYKIAFKGLKEGDHCFEYEIGESFFGLFESSLVQQGSVKATVVLKKQSTLMTLNILVDGVVTLQCDRCLEDYTQAVNNKNRLYVKFGHEVEDMGDDMIVVSYDDYQIDVAYYLYESIVFGLPLKHVHPDDENGTSTCNPAMLGKLEKYLVNEREEQSGESEVVDERWLALKKIFDNK